MKLYCPRCQNLFDEAKYCPKCNSTRMRPVEPTDPVLLTCADSMRAEMLAPVLEDEGIPFTYVGRQPNLYGMTTIAHGRGDVVRFYVAYEALERAQDIVAMFDNSFEENESEE